MKIPTSANPEEQSPFVEHKLQMIELQFEEKKEKFKLLPLTILLIVLMVKDANDLIPEELLLSQVGITVLSFYGAIWLCLIIFAGCFQKKPLLCLICLLLAGKIAIQAGMV